jgi:hypothetical protein
MLSEWNPWDFVKANPDVVRTDFQGPTGIWFFSAEIEPIILKRLPVQKYSADQKRVVLGDQLTRDWIERYLMAEDLFSAQESFLVLHAQNIPVDGLNYLKEHGDHIVKDVLFSFTKETKSLSSFFKDVPFAFHRIGAPKFYESGKLLSFLAAEFGGTLHYEVQNYLLEALDNDVESFVNALQKLTNHYSDLSKVTPDQVRSVVGVSRLDQFKMAQALSQKKFKFFFEKLSQTQLDFEQWRELFSFLQGHLLKLADPSYMQNKKRLSKYDQEIKSASKLWSEEELLHFSKYFIERETEAKQKSFLLTANLRKSYLKQLVRA